MGKRKASKESTGHVEQQCDVWLTAKPKPTKKQKVLRDPLSSIKNIVKFEPITVPNATKQTSLKDFFRTSNDPGCPLDVNVIVNERLDEWSPDYPERAAAKPTSKRDLNQGRLLSCDVRRKVHSSEKTPEVAESISSISCKQSTSKDQDNRDKTENERTRRLKEMTRHGVKETWTKVCSRHSEDGEEEVVTGENPCSYDRRLFKKRSTIADKGLRLSNDTNDLLKVERPSHPLMSLCEHLETDSSQIFHTGPVGEPSKKHTLPGCEINTPFESVSDLDSEQLTLEDESFLSNTTSELHTVNDTKSRSHKIRFIDPNLLHVNTASLCTQTQSMDAMNSSIDMHSSSDLGLTLEFDSELNSRTNKIRFIDPDRLSEISQVPN